MGWGRVGFIERGRGEDKAWKRDRWVFLGMSL